MVGYNPGHTTTVKNEKEFNEEIKKRRPKDIEKVNNMIKDILKKSKEIDYGEKKPL